MPELDVLTPGWSGDGRREWIVPDLVVVRENASYTEVMLAEPPLWRVEIQSAGQTLPKLVERAGRLLAVGCPLVWAIWPERRKAWEYSDKDLVEWQTQLTGWLPGVTDVWARDRSPDDVSPEKMAVRVDLAEMWAALNRPE